LLNNPEITTLIRDIEPHERALFTLDPDAASSTRKQYAASQNGPTEGPSSRKSLAHPLKESAVSRVLGTDMLREIRQSSSGHHTGGVNAEVLLLGAQKLCEVYSVAGAQDKIRALHNRHKEIASSVAVLEDKVAHQQSLVERKASTAGIDNEEIMEDTRPQDNELLFTEADLLAAEDEIRELEAKKQALEDRVSGIERDLGGLLK
jgi:hypothetical protein